ncbi:MULTISPECIES: hypothetical protein [Mesorhizobium]|nr:MULTISPECIES: hypothetical protein [unclassified Mesorhizobium]MCA0024752.1 hypothetical protein [Mesorhizobium sp. B263B1A]MCA0040948.1 hypothetical protein [Mesorhizobium sp. B292B1B]TPI78969.1 hypothetical protein FJ423_15945 [Mesorhizobium sp. B2-8-9]TPJ26731.1 hypothetical protein FJ425_17440 [Mesorhizobium sp. B2-7-2]TPJ38333.1 hypothetical protein FJ437_30680 [Mesorhizobium sp. B2-6-6]
MIGIAGLVLCTVTPLHDAADAAGCDGIGDRERADPRERWFRPTVKGERYAKLGMQEEIVVSGRVKGERIALGERSPRY